jgi:hypothetical protein
LSRPRNFLVFRYFLVKIFGE